MSLNKASLAAALKAAFPPIMVEEEKRVVHSKNLRRALDRLDKEADELVEVVQCAKLPNMLKNMVDRMR